MTSAPVTLAAAAIAFALIAAATTVSVAEFIPRRDGRPPRGGWSAHLACALPAAIVGACVAARVGSIETLAVTCVAVAALAAVAYSGFFSDGIPVDVPACATAIVAIASLIHGFTAPLVAAVATSSPFLITAVVSPNKRSTLRDGAVAAIGGSMLGLQYGIGATVVGAVVGVISFKTVAARAAAHSYAPYLACAFGAGVVVYELLG